MKRANKISLLPVPQRVEWLGGEHALRAVYRLQVEGISSDRVLELAQREPTWRGRLHPVGGEPVPEDGPVFRVAVGAGKSEEAQSYHLHVSVEQLEIHAADEAGLFYAFMTLRQVLRQCASEHLPCMRIYDRPDFPHRGVMLDISRNRVPTLETLFELVEKLSEWKINQLQLYTEHTFAYRNHQRVWEDASPMTPEEIRELDAFCRERFVELVPNQNSYGHLRNWLVLPEYSHLAETSEPFESVFGKQTQSWGLCPIDPESLLFLDQLYDELLPNFSSDMINVGCDEAIDLGKGRSKAACEEKGEGQVYFNYLLDLHRLLQQHGKRLQFWADMMNRYPAFIPQLPDDVIALEWGYEADSKFAEHLDLYRKAGISTYVCPGTSSWNALGGRTENAMANLLRAAEEGAEGGAVGYLVTDWGDNGHWQHLALSLPAFAYGAGVAWCTEASRKMDLASVLDQHVFGNPGEGTGQVMVELGNLYLEFGEQPFNATTLFRTLHAWDTSNEASCRCWKSVSEEVWTRVLERADSLRDRLEQTREVDSIIHDEVVNMAEFVRHACLLGLARVKVGYDLPVSELPVTTRRELAHHLEEMVREFVRVWNARSRQGWLNRSLEPLERLRQAYRGASAPHASSEKGNPTTCAGPG